jgi:hypothetical protein
MEEKLGRFFGCTGQSLILLMRFLTLTTGQQMPASMMEDDQQ